MRILQINLTYKSGSTGRIMEDINQTIIQFGNESYMLYAYSTFETPANGFKLYEGKMRFVVRKHLLESRISGKMGYGKKKATKKALEWIAEVNPDIIHIHNIHGNWINVEMLFDYIREQSIPIVWTLHDCWPFTGRCSHFENIRCEKWKNGCYRCANRKVYPITYFFDYSKQMWKDKREWFCGIEKMTIVTPSQWLAEYVKQSYLRDKRVEVINNGIDLNVFKPSNSISKYKAQCDNKRIVLGVAASWTERKGLADFYKIREILNKNVYQIILVGLNSKQLKEVPSGIIGIGRTDNVEELVDIYSSADVLVNPTYLDNYPTVNLEAIACGTPVITYRTGGSPESVGDGCGVVIEQGDVNALSQAIKNICERKYLPEVLGGYANKKFDKVKKFQEYIFLYERINRENKGR